MSSAAEADVAAPDVQIVEHSGRGDDIEAYCGAESVIGFLADRGHAKQPRQPVQPRGATATAGQDEVAHSRAEESGDDGVDNGLAVEPGDIHRVETRRGGVGHGLGVDGGKSADGIGLGDDRGDVGGDVDGIFVGVGKLVCGAGAAGP